MAGDERERPMLKNKHGKPMRFIKYEWAQWRTIQAEGGLPAFESKLKRDVLKAQTAAISYGSNNGLQCRTRKMRLMRDGDEWWRIVAQYGEENEDVEWGELFDVEWIPPQSGIHTVCGGCGRKL